MLFGEMELGELRMIGVEDLQGFFRVVGDRRVLNGEDQLDFMVRIKEQCQAVADKCMSAQHY
jgi:hypothetical protein